MKLVLRGHHLLCLKGFQGYGYSKEFSENMAKINFLRKQDDTTVLLVNSDDDICKACPNLKDNICENSHQNKKIIEMDNTVLSKITSAKEYDAVELFKKIDALFPNRKSVEKICLDCNWHEKCLFYQKLD